MNCSAYASINSVIVSSYSYWILSIDNVLEESKKIFEDVRADVCDIRKILLKFQERKEKFPDSYCDAYIGFCLPKLLNPLVRVQLINWSPLEVGASPDFIFVKNCVCVFVCSDILWASGQAVLRYVSGLYCLCKLVYSDVLIFVNWQDLWPFLASQSMTGRGHAACREDFCTGALPWVIEAFQSLR